MGKPLKIGLIIRSENSRYEVNYKKQITGNGAELVEICRGTQHGVVRSSLKKIDGLIIPGGADIEIEKYYKGPDLKALKKYIESPDAALDNFEFKVFETCLEENIPVFGICRGFQLINVYFGGTLYQDIPEQLGRGVRHRHDEYESLKPLRRKPVFHNLNIVKDGRLHGIFGQEHIEINSFHHQGVKELAPNLKCLATADDGLIEAFGNKSGPYILAVEFHPEKHCPVYGDLLIKAFYEDIMWLK